MAATAIHLVLMVKLLQGTESEDVSVGFGLWLLAAGLLGMALSGWLLVTAASRFRTMAATAEQTRLAPLSYGPHSPTRPRNRTDRRTDQRPAALRAAITTASKTGEKGGA